MLKDQKPIVVGIGWVVECVEQRAKVDESAFAIDLDGVNVAGIYKVFCLHLKYMNRTNYFCVAPTFDAS